MFYQILGLGALLAIGGPAPAGRRATVVLHTTQAAHPLQVELALTAAQHARGLMERPPLPDSAGMLFVFDHPARRSFWMHRTPAPLDMLFLDAQGQVVELVQAATPHSRRSRGGTVPSTYVLELAGGWAQRHGADLHSRLALPVPTP